MREAAVYARVSTSSQYGNYSYGDPEGKYGSPSYGYQVEDSLAKAQSLGYVVPESRIVCEVASGAFLDRQRGLLRILEWVKADELSAIFCYMPDRLTRAGMSTQQWLRDTLAAHAVPVIYVHERLSAGTSLGSELAMSFRAIATDLFREQAAGMIDPETLEDIAAKMRG